MKKLVSALLICLGSATFLCAQILAPIFFGVPSGAAACGSPVLTNLKGWYSADCMKTLGATPPSTCTTYADGHGFITNDSWADRSSSNDTLTIDVNEPSCVFKINKINTLPAVSFGGGGSGPDGSGNCGWRFATNPDIGATSWAVFIAFQSGVGNVSSTAGIVLGPNSTGNPSTFKYQTIDTFDCTGVDQVLVNNAVTLVGCASTAIDLNWHQFSVQFSNSSDQNSLVFRVNRGSDGPSGFTSTNITSGNVNELGVERRTSIYDSALNGRLAEILIYTGTGALLTAGNVTTNETYLNCRYGL